MRMSLIRAQRHMLIPPIAAGLLLEGIEEGIGRCILRPIGAQRVIIVTPIGQRTRGGASCGAGRAAAIEVIAIGGASHRAYSTAAGGASARVIR